VAWSDAVAEAILARVAGGEMLYPVCRDEGMPTPQSVGRWAKDNAAFGEALRAARVEGGRPARGGGGVWTYCEATAREVFDRLCAGESMTAICHDPTMPCHSTIHYWRRANPDFAETMRVGREVQAEQFCEMGWALAQSANPKTAYLTQVRLGQLRWMAGAMAPKTYRTRPAEPERPREVQTVLMRHFEVRVDPDTGKRSVAAFCPNPLTGEAECEDTPGWRAPPGMLPLPGGRNDE
jgi:hypothetical protein